MATPELSSLLRQVESNLGFSFEKVVNPHQYLQDAYPESYRAVMTVEEEMMRDGHGNTAFVDAEGRLLGVNLYGCKVTERQLQDMLKLAMPDLQALNLNQTGLNSFTFSDRQPALVHVNLSQNEALTSVSFDHSPAHLKSLDIYNCRVTKLTLPAGLDNLQKLDVARNKNLNRVEFAGVCAHLVWLDLSENALTELSIPAGFASLQYLLLRKNQLAKLEFAGSLARLETLDLRENQLKELPDNLITRAASLTHLFLYNNPWENIKDAVSSDERGNSRESVFSFLTSLQGEVDYLFEAKMILVGNGEVGKTSIRLKLINEGAVLPTKEERTPMIEIDRYVVKELSPAITKLDKPIDFTFNVWDFGGQGRYREIQQIFCSHKSLYLFVTAYDDKPEHKKEEEEYISFEYWLDMVTAYGHNEDENLGSPILIVINKTDQGYTSVDKEKYRLKDYPHIHPLEVAISCKPLKNFGQLREMIQELIPKISSDIFTTKRNTRWLAVKNILESRKKENYIAYTTYLDICRAEGLDEEAARTWIGMLDRIGTVIHFDQNSALKEMVILDPEWVRRSIVKILDADLLRDNLGVLKPSMYRSIWASHNEEEKTAFINLMLDYKLCYARKDVMGKPEYVVPACLPVEQPDLPDFLSTADYQVRIKYTPFIPAGTVNKLIVTIQQSDLPQHISQREDFIEHEAKFAGKMFRGNISVYNNLMWKNNAIFHDPDNHSYAHVKEDWDNNQVCIDLFGQNVRFLYEYLESALQKLNDELKATRYIRSLQIKAEVLLNNTWLELEYFRKKNELFFKTDMTDLQKLIEKGEIDRAFAILKENLDSFDQDTLLILRSRWNRNEQDNLKGGLDKRDYDLERNRITIGLNDMAKKVTITIFDDKPEPPPSLSKIPHRKIYFSYAWKDNNPEGELAQRMVEELLGSLKADGFPVVRDKEDLPYGGSISEFMQDVGSAPLIVVFTSPRYFQSPNCMYELCEIGRNATWNKSLFTTRILPIVLEFVNFGDPATLPVYIDHWDEQEKKWKDFFTKYDSGKFVEQNKLYRRIIDINRYLGDLGIWLNDINASSLKLHSDNDFSLIKKTIIQRLSQLNA
ncbi:MAG: COR domain-containing protein [Bacteroidia bacterium]|nr:COR domain-containing protein [Bacteroidia bacterium]